MGDVDKRNLHGQGRRFNPYSAHHDFKDLRMNENLIEITGVHRESISAIDVD